MTSIVALSVTAMQSGGEVLVRIGPSSVTSAGSKGLLARQMTPHIRVGRADGRCASCRATQQRNSVHYSASSSVRSNIDCGIESPNAPCRRLELGMFAQRPPADEEDPPV